ncbi:hypothetical protein FRC00_007526 [Tulasnella sp. 408]|nr:hypothetical protein FRC00_007526 [Tulasnella sp. 408]
MVRQSLWRVEAVIAGLNHSLALECIASLAKELEWSNELPELSFVSDSASIESASTLAALNAIETLASIEISIGHKNTHIDQFLEFFRGAIEDAEGDSTSFPSLRTLKIHGWKSDIDEIIDAVRQRYSNKAMRPRHQLVLDLTTLEETWFEDPESPKIPLGMDEVAELRGLDGVKGVRLGRSGEQSGMLAVVWSDQKSYPVLG